MPAGEGTGKRRVRFAKVFHDHPDERIKEQENPGQHSARLPGAEAEKPETAKKKYPLEKCFVNLRRVSRGQSLVQDPLQRRVAGAGLLDHHLEIADVWLRGLGCRECARAELRQIERFLRELHRPRHGRSPAIEFAVDEIRAAPEKQTDRRDDRDVIRQTQPWNVLPPPIKKNGEGEADHPAVTRHPAVPDAKDKKRIDQKLPRAIEERITKPAADDHADRCGKNEVANFFRGQSAVAALRQPAQKEKAAEKSEQIGKTVPANAEVRSKLDDEGTEIIEVVGDQSGSSVDQRTNDAEKKFFVREDGGEARSDEMKLHLPACLLLLVATGAQAATLNPAAVRRAAKYSAEHRGTSFLAIQNGKTLLEDYPGRASADTPQRIYSGTKAFWNLAALAAAEDRILNLDEHVADTIASWRKDPRKSQVTIRQLVDFSCGLAPGFGLQVNEYGDRDTAALRLPMVAKPGQAFIYGPSPLQVFHQVLKEKLHRETPTEYLEKRVLRRMRLGPQRYLDDRAGNPLLAAGFVLTARQWARMGQLVLDQGKPVIRPESLAQCWRGSPANRAFSLGWWNNRAAPGGREFDFEDMLEPKWSRQDWHDACLCRDAPPDLVACVGSGYQRLYVIPSLDLIVVRQGRGGKFSDAHFLRLLLGK